MKQHEIIKTFGTDYRAMTTRLLEEAHLRDHIPPTARCIGIKPNLVSADPAEYGGTTHPEVVGGIIDYLRKWYSGRIVILEGSWVGGITTEAFEVCGYNDLARECGVELWDMQKDTSSPRDCAGLELNVCDKVTEVDFLINVPVLKGHCQTKVTCALKNMKGLLPNKEKRRFHALGLHEPIGHLSAGIHQDFIVVDHICGDLDFEDGGHPVVVNCVMAACDPVLVDAYAADLLHYETDDIPYIRIAESVGVGSADISKMSIRVIGENVVEELPRTDKIVELKDAVQEVESCSACYGYLIPALDQLREEGLWEAFREAFPEQLCIGQGFRGKTGRFGIGNCTRDFEFNVPGCPPTETAIYEALKAEILRHRGEINE
ncbi:MAG: DUF362 domain-containing protein [Lachnospiraceae bacterium]|nr:DUF362 domain-containing protein [Lachnospiraceae bacterium]